MEYIEREITIKTALQNYRGATQFDAAEMVEALEAIPTADVAEVKHGKWFLLDECSNEGVYCSVCHKKVYRKEYANQKVKSNYCPNCGADMRGGKGE